MDRATVAIVGRPNVGKSTLFNRIVGGTPAIVDDEPGVTRDRKFGKADWAGKDFWVIDTGGWTLEGQDALSGGVRRQVELAIEAADVVLFLVDSHDGVHPGDAEVAEILRPIADRVVLVANKIDNESELLLYHAFHELGFGDPQPVSAATGIRSGDLMDRVVALLPAAPPVSAPNTIEVAVVGRPNVGKSSLVNRLVGEDRAVVAPEPGTTRDAIDSQLIYHSQTLNFIDTAGLRKRMKVDDDIEFYSRVRTERAIERADVAVLVVDAKQGFEKQDLQIAEKSWSTGCGLVVAVNKWDLVEEKDSITSVRGQKQIVDRAPFLEGVPFVYISALTGQRVRNILDLIVSVAAERQKRIATAEVNRVLAELVDKVQPPQKPGRPVNLLYATQLKTIPPTFAIVTNRPDVIPESYIRYLVRGFRKQWGFAGSPVRLRLRKKRGRR